MGTVFISDAGVFHSVIDLQPAINASLQSTTSNLNPSLGPPIQTGSSLPSNAGTKC
ncbi:hypothetical protein MES5069_450035 [Mesorhizobium escarrei]|uniref:Uncharacterized protein n=1 Tax=Mesorhizobium escarrei TaxID=666018 RepID=A0ABN8K6M6_9HYPH|nr:hypothetical protein MES5069_450035 [Mesorhizobium escarrei]